MLHSGPYGVAQARDVGRVDHELSPFAIATPRTNGAPACGGHALTVGALAEEMA